jgi:hypothetical protein
MVRAFLLLAFLGACGACGDDGATIDAPIDVVPPVDIDNGTCGSLRRFTGEYVDWDNDADFCGINGSVFRVQGAGTMIVTPPNGRVDICVPDQPVVLLDIEQGPDDSACTTPPSPYPVQGLAIANRDVITAQGGTWHGRAFTAVRQTSFFTSIGQPYDPAKGHLFIHVAGTPRALAIDSPHGPTQAVSATTWAAGDTGHEVFFPNIDIGTGTTMLTVSGGTAIGTGAIPLVAGKVTTLTIVVN